MKSLMDRMPGSRMKMGNLPPGGGGRNLGGSEAQTFYKKHLGKCPAQWFLFSTTQEGPTRIDFVYQTNRIQSPASFIF